MRMTTHDALAVNDQRSRENIRAFHGNADRQRLIGPTDEIARSETNARATVYVHRVIDETTHMFGELIFHDRRDDGRLLAAVEPRQCQLSRGVHEIGVSRDASKRLFDPLKAPDRHFELLAY